MPSGICPHRITGRRAVLAYISRSSRISGALSLIAGSEATLLLHPIYYVPGDLFAGVFLNKVAGTRNRHSRGDILEN